MIPDNIKHSFCAAKWLMVTMHFGMGENHSCYHPPIHRWDPNEIKKNSGALHNTLHKLKQRTMMLNGERPPECSYCWSIEDVNSNAVSDRKRFTSEPWALERLGEILNSPPDKFISPAYLEISFANTCNFACSYCSPGQSSRWEHEIKKYGSYPIEDQTVHQDKMHEMIAEEENPYITAFWKWIPEIYANLRYLRITGGEPLATRSFMTLLDYIATNENRNLTLVVNTNLCVPEKNLNVFFQKATALQKANTIKEIEVYTSMDTWEDHAEYIRDGLDIERWESTVRKVSKTFHVPIRVMVTFGLLSVFKFDKFVNKIMELRNDNIDIMFNCARLTDPKQFDLRLLPDKCNSYFDKVNDLICSSKTKTIERETWNMVYQYWKTRKKTITQEQIHHMRDQFVKFTHEYDSRRNRNFEQVFTEITLSDFYDKS